MKYSKTGLILVAVLLISAFSLADDDKDKAKDAASTITVAELRDHMYFLASDYLGGRVVGSRGYEIAAQYAISQYKAAGILPALKDDKGNPSYLQKLPLVQMKFSDDATWVLKNSSEIKESKAGLEMVAFGLGGDSIVEKEKELYFVGYGISEPEHGWDDLKDLELKDKIAIVLIDTPERNGKPVLPEELNKSYLGLNGLNKRMQILNKMGVESFVFLAIEELDAIWERLNDEVDDMEVMLPEVYAEDNEDFLVGYMNGSLSKFIMSGQEYSPYTDPQNREKGYKTFLMKDASIQLKAKREIKEIETWNVIGKIPGKDKLLRDEFVVVGGHLDHIPPANGEVNNGADDNASGSIGTIEIGEALMQKDNKRSILVCLWGSEETGLQGSEYFVKNSPVKLNKLKAYVNLDMIARSDKENKEKRAIYAMGANNAAPRFAEFITLVNTSSVNWPVIFEDEELGQGGSDHNSFAVKGIPSVFFFSGYHKDYHQPSDDAEKIDWEKFLNVTRLACSLVDSLANTDTDLEMFRRPVEKEVVH